MIELLRRVFTPSDDSLICMRDVQTGNDSPRALVSLADAGVEFLDFRHAA